MQVSKCEEQNLSEMHLHRGLRISYMGLHTSPRICSKTPLEVLVQLLLPSLDLLLKAAVAHVWCSLFGSSRFATDIPDGSLLPGERLSSSSSSLYRAPWVYLWFFGVLN